MTLDADIACILDGADPTRKPPMPPNAIRAPIDPKPARIELPDPIPASQLGEGDAIDWVWHGYIAREHVTLLSGIWKGGKTTLLSRLIQIMGDGGELAQPVEAGRVLIVSEESKSLWANRRDELNIGDHAEFLCRPFKGRPALRDWIGFVEHIARLIRERKYSVIVLDTIAALLPCDNENDASKMLTALAPLHTWTEAGAGVLLAHHPRKGDAGEAQAARGSGALPGFVDIILELRRFDASRREDRRRTLTAYSRFDETPDELVIELTDEGYRAVGTKGDARQTDRLGVIREILRADEPGMTAAEVRDAWPEGDGIPRPGKRTIENDLKHGASAGSWAMSGSGKKGNPYRFRLPNAIRAGSTSLGARNELGGDNPDAVTQAVIEYAESSPSQGRDAIGRQI
ncbi:MAG: AAA family ATPase [Planctomycetota bacterium]